MNKFLQRSLVAISLTLNVAFVFGIAAYRRGPEAALPLSPPDEIKVEISLPELVAEQLRQGDLNCPRQSPLTYEACLLYQGALGAWHSFGLANECPTTMRDEDEASGDRRLTAAPQLTPDDARRAPKSACFGYIYAIAVANATPILSSTALRSFFLKVSPAFLEPGSNAEQCIVVRHGICGNQTAVALALFEMAEIEARSVEFYFELGNQRSSHIIPEVKISESWRLIDTTYGAYWIDRRSSGSIFALAKTDDVIRVDEIKRHPIFNEALAPHGIYSSVIGFRPFQYLDNDADIIRGSVGSVSVDLAGDSGIENFQDKPNYIGDNVPNRPFSGIEIDLRTGDAVTPIEITIRVAASAVSGGKDVFICLDAQCRRFESNISEFKFTKTNPDRLYLKTENDVAYAIIKSISWKVNRQ